MLHGTKYNHIIQQNKAQAKHSTAQTNKLLHSKLSIFLDFTKIKFENLNKTFSV